MTRLIDADALIGALHNHAFLEGDDRSICYNIIQKQPAIDAVPVRHGKWEMKPDPFGFFDEIPVCSECGCTTKMREKTKYCPHCGARMDKDERD